jgi:hypothetical protein
LKEVAVKEEKRNFSIGQQAGLEKFSLIEPGRLGFR